MSRPMFGYTLVTLAVGEGIALIQHPSWGSIGVTVVVGLALRWLPRRKNGVRQ